MLSETARKALACPCCREGVSESGGAYECKKCGRRFPINNGVPHMLDEAEIAARTAERKAWRDAAILPPISYGLLQKVKSPQVHVWPEEKRTVGRLISECPGDAFILDIGSGALLMSERVTRLDLGAFLHVDVVGDAQCLPFLDESVDLVFIFRVLEHVRDPFRAVSEIRRVLKPGGRVAAVVPFIEPFHINPIDISRFTRDGVRRLFGDFEEEKCDWCVGPSAAVAWILKEYIAAIFPGSSNRWIYASVREAAGWILAPLRIVDRCLKGKPTAHKIAESFFYLGRKGMEAVK